MLTQSSPLYTVEVQCPCAMDDESPEIHVEKKCGFVTCENAVLFHLCIIFSD